MMDVTRKKVFVLVCIISCVIHTDASFISFKAYPSVLKANLTSSASMRCSLEDNPNRRAAVTNTTDDVTHVTSIVITNKDDSQIVAQGSPFEAPTGYIDSGNLMVKGDVSGTTSEGYLELSWRVPAMMTIGEYVCEIVTIDARHRHTVFRSTLVLERETTSLNDVLAMLQTQQHTIQGQQQMIQAQKQEILTQKQDMLAQKQESQTQQQLIQTLMEENKNNSDEIVNLKQDSASKSKQIDSLSACAKARVAFMATVSSPTDIAHLGDGTVVYDQVLVNTDQGYNPKTGEFTTNISGVYSFSVNALAYGGHDTCVRLMINSNKITSLTELGLDSNDYTSGSLSATVLLKSGDVVKVKVDGDCSSSTFYYVSSPSFLQHPQVFAGHLIHSDACLF